MALNNEIKIEGNIGNMPQARVTKTTGKPVTDFDLAVDNYAGKDETGKVKEEVMWVKIITWNDLAEKVAKLSKGDLVRVLGRLNIRKYKDKSGANREATEVIAQSVEKIILKKKEEAA